MLLGCWFNDYSNCGQMICWYFPFMISLNFLRDLLSSFNWKKCHRVIDPSVFVLISAEFLCFKHSYILRSVFDWDGRSLCKYITSVVLCFNCAAKSVCFFKVHYAKANPLTSVEIHRYNPEQNLDSYIKAIKQKEKTKLFFSNIWVLLHMAILQPYHSKSTLHPV